MSPMARFDRVPRKMWNVLSHALGHGWGQGLVLCRLYK